LGSSGQQSNAKIPIRIPDLGGFSDVAVIEVLVQPGERVEIETPLVTLESDKATMDVPSTAAGLVTAVLVKPGDKVNTGTVIAEVSRQPASSGDADETASHAKLRAAEPYGGEPYLDTVPIKPMSGGGGSESAPQPVAAAPGAGHRPDSDGEATTQAGAASYEFDLAVLGAGPGGYTAAFRAADLGLNVALVERWPTLGGVCLNVGCIPSKALLHAARVIEEAESMAAHGISFGEPQIDAGKLRDWKDRIVGRLTSGLAVLARQRKVTVISGVARFASPHELDVDGEEGVRRLSFARCIIAAGSEPMRLPGFPDDPRVMDSTAALELDLPARLLVIGGGIIGLEMATVYEALGVQVSVVELTDGLMPGCDRDLVKPLEKRLRARCQSIMLGTRVTAAEPTSEGLRVSFEGREAPAEPQTYDKVLVAVGRTPNGGSINAQAAGVAVDERGFIGVDRQMRTNVPHIAAIGDIVGQPMLAHKATHQGKVAAEVAAGQKSFFDVRAIPSVAYTDPEVAWVGLTETQARAEGISYEKAAFPWAASGRSLAMGRDEGMTKLLFDPESHRVVGGGIVGTSAGDLIAEIALAIEMGADARDIGLTVHPHPTLSETVAMAAEAFEGTLTDLYLPRRRAERGRN
jgi:dihydrolipoamide dehydrogenase